jgi:hypothetical protein
MNNRNKFNKFENTTFYANFNECIAYNKDTVDATNLEQYTHNMDFLLNTLDCVTTPTDDQLYCYIYNMESIKDEDVEDFKLFINIVFEKSVDMITHCKNIIHDNMVNTTKHDVKLQVINEIQSIKDIKQQERDAKRQLKIELADKMREDKRQLKKEQRNIELKLRKIQNEKDVKEKDIFNNSNVLCYCGINYIRCTKQYHMISKLHTHRIDMINYMLQPGVYDKYLTNTLVIDDTSIICSEDDDISSISSKSV